MFLHFLELAAIPVLLLFPTNFLLKSVSLAVGNTILLQARLRSTAPAALHRLGNPACKGNPVSLMKATHKLALVRPQSISGTSQLISVTYIKDTVAGSTLKKISDLGSISQM